MKFLIQGMMVFLVLASSAFAADIRQLDVGDGAYLQGIFSDELVQVIRIDVQNNLVKIRRSDSTTKWVSPSELISREDSMGNDVARGVIGGAIIACLLSPEACQGNGQ